MKIYSLLDEDIDQYGKYVKDKYIKPEKIKVQVRPNIPFTKEEFDRLQEEMNNFTGETIRYKYNNKQITVYQIKNQNLLRIDVRENGG